MTRIKRVALNMKNIKIVTDAAKEAARVLERGGVIVYPTDTVYGLGANALNGAAVRRVFAIKGRFTTKPLPVAVARIAMARRIAIVSKSTGRFLAKIWPGAVTVILPCRRKLSLAVGGSNSIGVRQPDHLFTRALFAHINFPITATSANIAGKASANDIQSFLRQFTGKKHKPDLIIDGGKLPRRKPSTVIDLTKEKPAVVRKGAVSVKKIFGLLKNISKRA